MRLCVFEDRDVLYLDPLTLTRPAFDLRCGAFTLLKRQRDYFAATEVGTLVRPYLAELCRFTHPELLVNDLAWLQADATVLVNARWLPHKAEPLADLRTPRLALAGDQVAYAVVPAEQLADCSPLTVDDCIENWKQTLPPCVAGGSMIDYPWDLVDQNAAALNRDFLELAQRKDNGWGPANVTVVGPSDRLRVATTAEIEPLVVMDTTSGPVIIDREAVVQSFSRLEGPCYVGPRSWVVGAKVRGSTIGPLCRVGGEVEASIIHGYSNKYHDGFLGHSYVGEWVNLGAGTQVSDLRNDYGSVQVTVASERIDTGRTKVGSFIGDHTKTGLNTLLNTGTVVGAFCNLLPTGMLLPKVIPSFCTYWNGRLEEGPDLPQLVRTAATAMQRRNCELTSVQAAFFRTLHEQTAARRRQVIRESEQRRLRRQIV